jgi:hypothetical protein
MEDFDKKEI